MPDDALAPISKEMRKDLRSHWKRTGVSTRRVLERNAPIPDGLTVAMVNDWIANRLHEARPSHWNFVLSHWMAMPNGSHYEKRIAARQKGSGRPRHVAGVERITLTPQMSAQFRAELIRTNADWERDILNAPDIPTGLTYRVLVIWKYLRAKTTRADHWEFAMARLATLPDFRSKFRTHQPADSITSDNIP